MQVGWDADKLMERSASGHPPGQTDRVSWSPKTLAGALGSKAEGLRINF
jgi:hypothetical protein